MVSFASGLKVYFGLCRTSFTVKTFGMFFYNQACDVNTAKSVWSQAISISLLDCIWKATFLYPHWIGQVKVFQRNSEISGARDCLAHKLWKKSPCMVPLQFLLIRGHFCSGTRPWLLNSKIWKFTKTEAISGVATGVARGAECHPWQRENCQKSGKIQEKEEKSGRKGINREVLPLCPFWQIGLATLEAIIINSVKWPQVPCYTGTNFFENQLLVLSSLFSPLLQKQWKAKEYYFHCWLYHITVTYLIYVLQQNREQVAQAYFEIWTIEVGKEVKNNPSFNFEVFVLCTLCLLSPPYTCNFPLIFKHFPTKNSAFSVKSKTIGTGSLKDQFLKIILPEKLLKVLCTNGHISKSRSTNLILVSN